MKKSLGANSKISRKPGRSRYSIRMSVRARRASSSRSVMSSAREIWFFIAESQNSGMPFASSAVVFSSLLASGSASSSSSSDLPAAISSSVGSVSPLTMAARFSYSGVNFAKYFFSSCSTSSWNSASNLAWSFWMPFKPVTRRRTTGGNDSI